MRTEIIGEWRKRAANLSKRLFRLPEFVKLRISRPDLRRTYLVYDRLTGLDQVRSAHEEVAQAEKTFSQRQVERRAQQTEVFRLEEARNRLNSKLDSVSRSDDNFIQLVTELHDVSRLHKEAREKLREIELSEQVAFEQFSGSLRRSQAEERVQANRMRQWSIGLSVLAGLVGFGATWLRYRQMNSRTSSVVMASDSQATLLPLSSLTSMLQNADENLRINLNDLHVINNKLKHSTDILERNLSMLDKHLMETQSQTVDERIPLFESVSSNSQENLVRYGLGAVGIIAVVLYVCTR
ncbi:unnamed protein product [Calicophoron daubneyi]|uniref:Coiled-coil domain-containing protein 51 n=1 Tax=Calicophoron daubneyi TaxID=300641 RepID=A0AAV2TTC0_CALDB